MRYSIPVLALLAALLLPLAAFADESQPITLATHNQTRPPEPEVDTRAVTTIKNIILNQGDDARALANLVQLTRNLPAPTTVKLYDELSDDYLQHGKYNQAASVLQQLLNQYPNQPDAAIALVKLMQLYSSSEVALTQNAEEAEKHGNSEQKGYLKYAQYLANGTLHKNSSLADEPAIIFQRAVVSRLADQQRAAKGMLTPLKHRLQPEIWRTRALAEQWLLGDREEEPPKECLVCAATDQKPHLDGLLSDSLWGATRPLRFAYDKEFLYIAISCEKDPNQSYQPDSQPRTHDAELAKQDQIQIHLDADRDYATYYELKLDYRGRTNDRCWLDASWNPQWFVAAGGDSTHWTVEAAIPWQQIAYHAPQPGDAWAFSYQRAEPNSSAPDATMAAASAEDAVDSFQLLLFQ